MNPNRRKVLQVTAIPITAAQFLLPLARALRDRGYSIHFASGPGEGQAELAAAGFPVHTAPLSRRISAPSNLAALRHLTLLLRRERFGVLHAHTPIAGLVARLAAQAAGTEAVLYTLHGSVWGDGSALRTHVYTLAERLGALCTDRVFVLNGRDGQDLIQRRMYRASQVTNLGVGGSGVDLERFHPAAVPPASTARLRAALGIPAGSPVIGYLGRTAREKGLLDLVQAFVLVQHRHPGAHLLLAGGALEGERDAASEAEILAALDGHGGLRSQIHLTGFRSDVPDLLSLATVVALPSWREGFGLALAEAGAMGLPVVATRTRGGEQAVTDGQNGLLVPVRRPDLLAEALSAILADPRLARRLGQAGRQRAVADFGQAATVARQLTVYEELCSR